MKSTRIKRCRENVFVNRRVSKSKQTISKRKVFKDEKFTHIKKVRRENRAADNVCQKIVEGGKTRIEYQRVHQESVKKSHKVNNEQKSMRTERRCEKDGEIENKL